MFPYHFHQNLETNVFWTPNWYQYRGSPNAVSPLHGVFWLDGFDWKGILLLETRINSNFASVAGINLPYVHEAADDHDGYARICVEVCFRRFSELNGSFVNWITAQRNLLRDRDEKLSRQDWTTASKWNLNHNGSCNCSCNFRSKIRP